MSTVLYARVSDEAHAYVTRLAEESSLPVSRIVDGILIEAQAQGWSVQQRPIIVTDRRGAPGNG